MPEQSCIILDNNWTFFLVRRVRRKETWWFCCQSLWNEYLTRSRRHAQQRASLSRTHTSVQEMDKEINNCSLQQRWHSLNTTINLKGVKSHIKYKEQATSSINVRAARRERSLSGHSAPRMQHRGPALQTEAEFCLLQTWATAAQGVCLKAGD